MAAEERGGKRQRKWRVRVEGEGGVVGGLLND